MAQVSADFDGNGQVDMRDFAAVSGCWMNCLAWSPDGMLPQMLAHWTLDGDAMDSQGVFDGVAYGEPTWYSRKMDSANVKVGGGAMGLSGHDYIEVAASGFPAFYGSFTLDAWIKTGYAAGSQTIIARGGSWQMGIKGSTGKGFFSCPGLAPAGMVMGESYLADGQWHHVAAVYDHAQERMYFYVDGQIDGQAPATGQAGVGGEQIWIGGDPETAGQWWHGVLDDIRVYNHALSLEECFQQKTWHVNGETGTDQPLPPDPEWGQSRQKCFRTIQHAIDVAADGDVILVWPGLYRESIFFMGKAVTVRSVADAAVLEPAATDPGRIAVTFQLAEQADSVLEHFVIVNSDTAIWLNHSSPTLRHLTVVNNDLGLRCIFTSRPRVEHCIFWGNATDDVTYDTYVPDVSHSCLQGSFPGQGNFSSDPFFVNPDSSDPNTMDFHLCSEYGRYRPGSGSVQRPSPASWVVDNRTSPCIDAGRADINPFCETMSNGGRINIGAYGNRPFASKSPWPMAADMNRDGAVGCSDLVLFSEQWLTTGQ